MVTDAQGKIAETIALENKASKGKGGGRMIPLHPKLRLALAALHVVRSKEARVEPGEAHFAPLFPD